MTQPDEFEPEAIPSPVTASDLSISFSVPNVPYSQIKASIPPGSTPEAVQQMVIDLVTTALHLHNEVMEAFPFLDSGSNQQPDRYEEPQRVPVGGGDQRDGYNGNDAPRGSQVPQRGNGGGFTPQAVAYCAQHGGAPVFMSAPKYNKDGDRCYHPLDGRDRVPGGGANHNMYWRETVDERGNPNSRETLPQYR